MIDVVHFILLIICVLALWIPFVGIAIQSEIECRKSKQQRDAALRKEDFKKKHTTFVEKIKYAKQIKKLLGGQK